MRNKMWNITICMLMILSICIAAFENDLYKMAPMALAVLTVCVYMVCESRVQRANAPLILRDESVYEKTKPPEDNNN